MGNITCVVFLDLFGVKSIHKAWVFSFHILEYIFQECLHGLVIFRNGRVNNKTTVVKCILKENNTLSASI